MLRKMKREDAPAIKEICETALGYSTTVETIEQRLHELENESDSFLVVFEDDADGQVKGFLQAQRYTVIYGGAGWNIISLAVRKESQNSGIGKNLVAFLEAQAMADGSDFVRLNSRVERPQAHAFYEHLGYTCDKTQKRFIKKLKNNA